MHTIIVFKTHVDIGFTDLAQNVVKKYCEKLLPLAVDVCEQTQQNGENGRYTWTLPSWMMKQYVDSALVPPDLGERVRKLIKKSQLVWHSLPFTTHTEFTGLEEFIRGLLISKKLSDEFGRRPVSAKMTDVPGHTWMLPSILAGAGVKFLHLGSNQSSMPPDVPRLFWWEGPDKQRVLVFYSEASYGSSLIPPDDWPYPVWLALMHTGDNQGPQNVDSVNAILDEFKKSRPDDMVSIGTLDDFYNELVKFPLNIPVIKKDIADTWIHGTGSYPIETGQLRILRGKLTETEKIVSVFHSLGLIGDAEALEACKKFDDAYENCLLFGEHTWGMDVKTWLGHGRHYSKKDFLASKSEERYIKIEQSWDEQRRRVRDAKRLAEETSMIFTPDSNQGNIRFNGLGWPRDGLPGFGFANAEGHIRQHGKAKCNPGEGLLENDWFIIRTDAVTGTIKSLYEKTKNREWVDLQETHGFGHYRYDIYGKNDITEFIRSYTYQYFDWSVNDYGRIDYPDQQHLTFYENNFLTQALIGEDSASLQLKAATAGIDVSEYGNAREITFTITLYDEKPVIDLRYDLGGKQETPMIEAGHFVFPLKLDYATVNLNKLGCVLDIRNDIIDGANHSLHCLEH
ncbi:MAG: hypothetical protein FWF22_07170, partial [Treponema sp.]|nr:hypothetical protein [Treponema sp.]